MGGGETDAARGEIRQELPGIEIAKLAVPLEDASELGLHRLPVAREEHPQVLDRRARPAVVEVDEMRPVATPQDVARVTVAVQAQT